MFQAHRWPSVVLHFDGDAFFASVIQAVKPQLRGKPIAVGRERGIATAFSYEAKKMGVKRGMTAFQVKKACPACIFIESDYELYTLFSQKMFAILNSFFPQVEQYSIDEGFVDLKGLRRPLNMTYYQMGKAIKDKIESSLGISVSVGISLTKSLAKLASSWQKPSAFNLVDGFKIEEFLKPIPLRYVWGIGENTAAYLRKLKINTALDFVLKPEKFITAHLTKPYLEIWHELRGEKIYQLNSGPKQSCKSMSKSQTFYPPTSNGRVLWARLMANVEAVFKRARLLNYRAGKLFIFLKTQRFNYQIRSIKLLEKTAFPLLIKDELKQAFAKIYQKGVLYRATGCYLTDLTEKAVFQPNLFTDHLTQDKIKKIYSIWETKKIDFATSLLAQERKLATDKVKRMKTPLLLINNLV